MQELRVPGLRREQLVCAGGQMTESEVHRVKAGRRSRKHIVLRSTIHVEKKFQAMMES
jgi:hypothetical protein